MQVQAASLEAVTVTLAVRLATGYSLAMVSQTIRDQITALIAGLDIGAVLYTDQIELAALQVPGVVEVSLSSPASNTDPTSSGRCVLSGSITVTAL
jgi:uncharacterized phage protein gp47/JayE